MDYFLRRRMSNKPRSPRAMLVVSGTTVGLLMIRFSSGKDVTEVWAWRNLGLSETPAWVS